MSDRLNDWYRQQHAISRYADLEADLKTAMDQLEALSKRHAKLLAASKDCFELLEEWFPLLDDMRCASESDSKKIDRLKEALKAEDDDE